MLVVLWVVLTCFGEEGIVKNRHLSAQAVSLKRRNPLPHCASTHNRMLQNEGLKVQTEAVSLLAGCCEHGNEQSRFIIWRNFLTVCVTMSFLKRTGIKFHFTSLHTCTIQLNPSPVLCLTCWCLTLRRLISYIYMEHSFLMFLDHTQRRSTVGRAPLDE